MMRKLLFLILLLNSQHLTFAQERTHLPYSIFGIGEIRTKGFVRNMGMGRSGIALSSDLYLNNQNPASYHSIDSISFFFDVGAGGEFVKYSTARFSQEGKDFNLRNIAMGFRFNRFWSSSIGIAPYSSVGYKIVTEKDVVGTLDKLEAEITGNGGLTQFYWDHSVVLLKRLSLGVNFTYNFGTIETVEKLHYDELDKEIFTKQTYNIKKVYADFGAQYFFPIKPKIKVTLGAVFGNNHQLNYKESINIYDSDDVQLEDKVSQEGKFSMPWYYGAGIAVEYNRKLTISADYRYDNWSNTASGTYNFTYRNTNTFRIGAEYIPGRLNQLGYMGRLSYRLGYYHEDSPIAINNYLVADDGISVGVGLPFGQNKTSINLAYNYGIRGSTENGLIKEKYHAIMLSMTLHDWWFIKRRYD